MIAFTLGVIFGLVIVSVLNKSTEYIYTKEEYDEMVKRKNDDIDSLLQELKALERVKEE